MHPEPTNRSHPATRGLWRLARIFALGGVSMLLATAAHSIGGGRLPSAGVLLVATFLVGLTAITVTARRSSFTVLASVLGLEQLLLHEVLTATAMTPSGCADGPTVGHGAAMGCLVGADPSGQPAVQMAGSHTGMLLAHLAATVATAWLLSRGEAFLWRLSDRAARAASAAPTLRLRRALPARPLPDRILLAASRRTPAEPRGPPVLVGSV